MNTSLLSNSAPSRATCPYCGERYDTATSFTAATHEFYRWRVGDDTFIETCTKEIGEFIGRSMKSRYVDGNGDPK